MYIKSLTHMAYATLRRFEQGLMHHQKPLFDEILLIKYSFRSGNVGVYQKQTRVFTQR